MINDSYQLRYLPLFFDDVKRITSYIKNELSNLKAANDLIDAVEEAILERLPVCESFEPYHSKRERKYTYYRIYVKNYVVYYVVIDDEGPEKIMEIRRLLFNRQDRENVV
ncbi:MAG: type II toxin-antitoxin system RelE/ParE family toxin [Clostridia bacterium]|nr:type II toxin-antitoxin system RelE/ParE family toxin [Clostridia bacterium]